MKTFNVLALLLLGLVFSTVIADESSSGDLIDDDIEDPEWEDWESSGDDDPEDPEDSEEPDNAGGANGRAGEGDEIGRGGFGRGGGGEVSHEPVDDTLPGFFSKTWPGGVIPYEIDVNFQAYQTKRIEDCINVLNTQGSCVRFRSRRPSDEHYLSFKVDSIKCMSKYIGLNFGEAAQTIYLAQNCSTSRYIYWVLLQALGLPAEHMRPNRDTYIKINWENIDPRYRMAFKKYEFIDPRLENSEIEYDFESRLHYLGNMFSLNPNSNTIEARDAPERPLGNPLAPTYYDYKKIAALYCDPDNPLPTRPPIDDPVVGESENPGGIFAGLDAPRPTVKVNCACRPRPNAEGHCEDRPGGFQFVGQEVCYNSIHLPVCACDSFLLNPCYCKAVTEPNCNHVSCPKTRCERVCPEEYFRPYGQQK